MTPDNESGSAAPPNGNAIAVNARGERGIEDYAQDWEQNAQLDAKFAILSDPDNPSWKLDHFLAAGEAEIATVFDYLRQVGILPRSRGVAMDFGCGLGRLTQALARRFDRAIGVDVSPTMVAEAGELAGDAPVEYVVNQNPDLRDFGDGEFDFVYSNIVLQHVSNHLQAGYIGDFVRVLRLGGVAVFQVPSMRRGFLGFIRRHTPNSLVPYARRLKPAPKSFDRDAGNIRMEMNCMTERSVHKIVGEAGGVVRHVVYSNATLPDFNGDLELFGHATAWEQAARGGYVSPVYVVTRAQATPGKPG